ncbi:MULTISPECIES: phosphoglycerate dehydrogenase [unclassified Ectothiorhodospira]|uniref:phosphoglycerate dehydrogenase n=1 Tax=unclassified Ectothiorhodospira TaxID=2684909 RepID=UPI001EE917A7|nr:MULTISPECIES: phosphoglycerate dehydrogenase [unclassified Ectothiorhodospira]MCG5515985.1 phosphoglycerate dehydrogenase [Ectothiorhodospira sp. 9100]MCG5518999.1 phosphoglycerate dehydrogenase [Ectothiorhodospira sp. 9905]
MYKILTLNNISPKGLDQFGHEHYEVASEMSQPDAIMVRSANMHDMEIPTSLKAVGRAGAGVNNIPIDAMSERGVAVFNAPGANANAVKEMVLAGMLLAARNICQAWDYARHLEGDDAGVHKQVEAGKKQYAGFELPSRTLGVVGLGAIGVQVANAARALGMRVVGYDPHMTVNRAWQLDAAVEQAVSVDDLLSRCDMVTFHVPLNDYTRHLINSDRLHNMKRGSVVLNFARDAIVDEQAVLAALASGQLHAYVCDFPSNGLKGQDKVIALPHLGASTREAEENCAVMVGEQLRDYLENGNVRNSVNLPEIMLPRAGKARLAVMNRNRPDMVGQISHVLGQSDINIVHMMNESRNGIAYNLIDVEDEIDEEAARGIAGIDGVLRVRVL